MASRSVNGAIIRLSKSIEEARQSGLENDSVVLAASEALKEIDKGRSNTVGLLMEHLPNMRKLLDPDKNE